MKFAVVFITGVILVWSTTVLGADSRCPQDNGDGTMTDKETGLIWQACPLGQRLVRFTPAHRAECGYAPSEYFWEEALMIAKDNRFQNKDDWMLPTYNQLAELSNWNCVDNPGANWSSFPGAYWTSTKGDNSTTARSLEVSYRSKRDYYSSRHEKYMVLLVRAGQQPDIDQFNESIAEITAKMAAKKPQNGKGVFIFPSGNRYEGDWKDGKRHGSGILVMPSGDRYEGGFKKDEFSGYGIYTWKKSGQSYSGQWVNGNRHGEASVCGLGLFGSCERQVYVNDKKSHTIHDEPSSSGSASQGERDYSCKIVCRTSGLLYDTKDLGEVRLKAYPYAVHDKMSEICNKLSGNWYPAGSAADCR